ncbi:MAG: hypothetical protein U5L00_17000 [Desulfovermiculus sp.]|nr:hypothetical protein [Desulfovermiculus sp.]
MPKQLVLDAGEYEYWRLIVIMTTCPWPRPDQGGELEKENPPLAPPYRLEDRRQGGELRGS